MEKVKSMIEGKMKKEGKEKHSATVMTAECLAGTGKYNGGLLQVALDADADRHQRNLFAAGGNSLTGNGAIEKMTE